MRIDTHQVYIFEFIDPTTRCIVYDTAIHDLTRFCEVIDRDPAAMEPGACYELEALEVACVLEAFAISYKANGCYGLLRPQVLTDQLSYKVHTGRELLMMLAGTKPLAIFSDTYPSALPPFEVIPEDVFAPHVQSGRLVKREVIESLTDADRNCEMRTVCYALPTERWRIDAYLLLYQIGHRFGWSETCERMEGTLLGYTDEQNDAYIELVYRRHVRPPFCKHSTRL